MQLKNKLAGLAAAVALATGSPAALAAEKPSELHIGISTYLSGSASVFGVPGKEAADIMIVPAELVTPPVGMNTFKWIEAELTPDVLNSDQLKSY